MLKGIKIPWESNSRFCMYFNSLPPKERDQIFKSLFLKISFYARSFKLHLCVFGFTYTISCACVSELGSDVT